MNDDLKVSVVILTFYHEQYIASAINSVLSQICNFNYEIIIADDASQDRTIEIITDYKKKHDGLIKLLLHEQNVGTTRNLYDAYMECKGTYIVTLAGDDSFIDDLKIQKQVDFLEVDDNKEFIGVGTTIKQVYSDGKETGLIVPDDQYRGKEFLREKFLQGNNYPIHGLMFRNIFDDPRYGNQAKEKFKYMYKFSKYIEDLTENMFFFDYGKIHILKDITYSVLTRKPSEVNQHNYNSIRKRKQMIEDHLLLLKNLQEYYGDALNLQKRFEPYINGCITIAFRKRNMGVLKALKGVSCKYIVNSVVQGGMRRIIRKGGNGRNAGD